MRALIYCTVVLTCAAWNQNSFCRTFEEVEREALSTAIPSAGSIITYVVPGSQADQLGLKVGDFAVRDNRSLILRITSKKDNRTPDNRRRFYFVREDGTDFIKTIEDGKIGLYYMTTYRPELAYIRGEMGVRDKRWDRSIVSTFLSLNEGKPEVAFEFWERAQAAGYPAPDEFSIFLEAYLAWCRGLGFDSMAVYDAVFEEFGGSIPDAYFPGVERLAIGGNNPEVLERIRTEIPHNNHFTDRFVYQRLEIYESNSTGVKTEGSLLERAMKMKLTDVTQELLESKQREDNVIRETLSKFFRLGALDIPQRSSRGWPREPSQNLHVSLKVSLSRLGKIGKSGQSAQFYLSDYHWVRDPDDLRFSNVLIGFAFSTPLNGEGMEYRLQGSGLADHLYLCPPFPVSIPMRNTGSRISNNTVVLRSLEDGTPIIPVPQLVEESEYGAQPIMIDMIRIDGEAAVFINGVCQHHTPVSESIDDIYFSIFLNGMKMTTSEFAASTLE